MISSAPSLQWTILTSIYGPILGQGLDWFPTTEESLPALKKQIHSSEGEDVSIFAVPLIINLASQTNPKRESFEFK